MGAGAEIQGRAQGLGARCASEKVRAAACSERCTSRGERRAGRWARATPQGGARARCLCSAREAMPLGACRSVTRPPVNLSQAQGSLGGARVGGTRRAGENGRRVGGCVWRVAFGGRGACQSRRQQGANGGPVTLAGPRAPGMGLWRARMARRAERLWGTATGRWRWTRGRGRRLTRRKGLAQNRDGYN